ncbi:MAG: PD-(D/E)XK nuclease family protein [Planctomycetota bacterium]|jgi:ATP-dependent helicase/nuclease subunit B
MTSVLIEQLADVCASHLLDEKWLVAPSRRIAHQWLDQVSRSVGPVVNVRVKTMRSLALDLLAGNAPRMISAAATKIVVASAWEQAVAQGDGYLADVRPTPRLMALVERAVLDLRLAGLQATDLSEERFEHPRKGTDLRSLVAEYEVALSRGGVIDVADVLRAATGRLREGADSAPEGALLLLPADLYLTRLESELIEAYPSPLRRVLPVDEPAAEGENGRDDPDSDRALLAWIGRPAEAPEPIGDATVRITHAVGEANEVRQVFRGCLQEEIALDEVEVVFTAADPYVSIIYETALRVLPFDPALELGVPVTFADGVPARLTRPGRLLAAWLNWIRDDFPQSTLVRMVQDGLLVVSDGSGGDGDARRLVRALRDLWIGFGRERYVAMLDQTIRGLERRVADGVERAGEEDEPDAGATERLQRRLEDARALRVLSTALLDASPARASDAASIVTGAATLVREHARAPTRLDRLARQRLLEELQAMAEALPEGGAPPGFDAWAWLEALPEDLRVGGSGPKPGHLHAASLRGGGHSGRPHTWIIGLDDARFPPAGLQDPLLLDAERERISDGLPTSLDWLRRQLDDFTRLLCRLRGRVTLSFPCRDVAGDAETFASTVVLSAFRIVSGRHDGDHHDLVQWLDPPCSFAPVDDAACLDEGEWWLWCGGQERPAENLAGLVAAVCPHLAQGQRAAEARASTDLTVFDGWVEAPGPELDPTRPEGPTLSASRLSTLGTCPLQYFYKYVLKLDPPRALEPDADEWLDALQFGTLMHDVLYDFVRALIDADCWPPQAGRDADLLRRTLETNLDRMQDDVPPPNEEAYRRRRRELEQAAHIFLTEQADAGKISRPLYLEASIGLPSVGAGSEIDTEEPVVLELPDGSSVRVRARLDRVDRLESGAAPAFMVFDYKSGGYTKPYEPTEIFKGGVFAHPVLYIAVAEMVLQQHFGASATVSGFNFFFPRYRARGRMVLHGRGILDEGLSRVALMCRAAAAGVHLPTDAVEHCRFCDYRSACLCVSHSLEALCAASGAKLSESAAPELEPLQELRRDG